MSRVLQEGTSEYKVANLEYKDLYAQDLIAAVIGGDRGKRLATALMKKTNSLRDIARMDKAEMMALGLTLNDHVRLKAAFRLGAKAYDENRTLGTQITSSNDAYELMKSFLRDLPHEEFWVLYLNSSNRGIKRKMICKGGIAGTVADKRLILKNALDCGATAMILFHNHPSGKLNPSFSDDKLTKEMKQAAEIMDISVLDHIIISSEGYYSYVDEGTL
jgi:DNA repair protein RadC